MSTEDAYSKLLPLLIEMSQDGIMSKRLKENIIYERIATYNFFSLFILDE